MDKIDCAVIGAGVVGLWPSLALDGCVATLVAQQGPAE